MYISMALLLVSTIQEAGPIGHAAKMVCLAFVALLTAINVGAALGVYIAAVALFAVFGSDGWGSVVERPDNYALLLVVGGLTWRIVARGPMRAWDRSMLVIGGFLAYALLQIVWMGLLTRVNFAAYMRMFGLPMLMFLLLAQHGLSLREFRALVRSLLVLGAYMALVSIFEQLGWYDLIVPAWIATPSEGWLDAAKNFAVLSGRSGGLLMQSEYNGLALSLIYCVAILSTRLDSGRGRAIAVVVGILCLVGIIFTFTRAAWLACVPASLALLWRPSTTLARTQLKRFGLVAATVIVVLVLVFQPDSFARQRIGESGAVFARLNLWKAGLSMATHRPLLGTGFSTFAANLEDYQHEMTVGLPMKMRGVPAHNLFLSLMVELGAIGLVLYAGALVAIFRRAKAAAQQTWGREGALWVAVFVGVYVLQVQFMNIGDPTTNQICFGMLGAVAGLLGHGQFRGIRASTRPRTPKLPMILGR
jgi:O-antigen ligase